MPTVNKTLTANADWEEVTIAYDFLIQNVGSGPVSVRFDDALPTGDQPHHELNPGQSLVRNGLTGNVYAKAEMGGVLAVTA